MVTYLKNNPSSSRSQSSLLAHFYPAPFLCSTEISLPFRNIFLDVGSMTKIIKKLSNDRFDVTVLKHSWEKPHVSEQKMISLENKWGIGREVVLHGINQPWIFARSFFPEAVVKAHGYQFLALGQRPLGEILFNNPKVVRGDFSIACLYPWHREYQVASNALGQSPECFWARRSQFFLPDGAITLLEVFSPLMEQVVVKSEKAR